MVDLWFILIDIFKESLFYVQMYQDNFVLKYIEVKRFVKKKNFSIQCLYNNIRFLNILFNEYNIISKFKNNKPFLASNAVGKIKCYAKVLFQM